MKLAASYLTLSNVDGNEFRIWLKTLPVLLTEKNILFLLDRSDYRKAVLWTSEHGFKFID